MAIEDAAVLAKFEPEAAQNAAGITAALKLYAGAPGSRAAGAARPRGSRAASIT